MPILDPNAIDFVSRSPDQTRRLGMRLGALLRKGDVICLQGDLGAGKTTFTQGIAQGWATSDDVSSPTFVIVNTYRRPDESKLFHLDCYRIDSPAEAEELDLIAMLAEGPLVIEWADRIKPVLPADHLWIMLNYMDEEQRQLQFRAHGAHYEALLQAFRKSAFGGD
jgi:tRNA threonylcarbamoyladenosine biosynthesis protein TsaE